jgi:hypothetical protein
MEGRKQDIHSNIAEEELMGISVKWDSTATGLNFQAKIVNNLPR